MVTQLGFTLTTPRLLFAPLTRPYSPVSSSSCCSSSSSHTSRAQFNSSVNIFNRKLSSQRRLLIILPKAAEQGGQVQQDEVIDSNMLPYCNIDKKEKKSLGELEQDFLQALQSFYYDGKAIMSNEEFDNLKEELMWEGSSVVMLSSDEQKFLEAAMAYASGKPILADDEYDKLKLRLKVYSDLAVDYFKMFLLNVPAALVALTLFFFLDDITGFEITYLLELPEPFSFIFTWFAALPLIFFLAQAITKAIVKDFLILKGACPNCGTENVSFFGTILSVSSGGSTNKLKCSKNIEAQGSDSPSHFLDHILGEYAFRSFTKYHKTGFLYKVNLPSNLSDIGADTARFRCGSLRRYGAQVKEFGVAVGVKVHPCVERVVVVRHNLGETWSSIYFENYNVSGYQLVSPLLGLLAYDATNLNLTNLAQVGIFSGNDPIRINFSNVMKTNEHKSGSAPVLCAKFYPSGRVSFTNQVSPNVCVTKRQGHFGLVVKIPMFQNPGKVSRWKLIIGISIGGGLGVFLLVLLVAAMVIKVKKKSERAERQRRAYEEEALQVSMVGHVRAHTAPRTRTQPSLEEECVPTP
ncbi:hypothetical protein GIB67_019103 [Kingdonia uniflora]|uniref:Uncharacterized protein n=1 Tax=Kingdonia uniflora TaxID=39325 RepID=A0A7J7MZV2_9MAGN|nr:hypothetical protein GIB67_019103 [Kingdonia uniflora]